MTYGQIVRKNWEIIVLVMTLLLVFGLLLTVLMTFKYKATGQLLIIQKQDFNIDAYTANKSAERIAKNLSKIVYTSNFYNSVIDTDKGIGSEFSEDDIKRRKQWQENIAVKVYPETGILEIAAYNQDKEKANLIATTLSNVLVNRAAEYHGGGSDVEVKVIDDVFVSQYPVKPNILLNLFCSLFLGFIFGNLIVLMKHAKKMSKIKEYAVDNDINDLESESIKPENLIPELKDSEIKDLKFAPVISREKENLKEVVNEEESEIFEEPPKPLKSWELLNGFEPVFETIIEEKDFLDEDNSDENITTMYDHLNKL